MGLISLVMGLISLGLWAAATMVFKSGYTVASGPLSQEFRLGYASALAGMAAGILAIAIGLWAQLRWARPTRADRILAVLGAAASLPSLKTLIVFLGQLRRPG